MSLYLRKSRKPYSLFKFIISVSNRYASEYASHEQSKFMQKLLSRSAKSKKQINLQYEINEIETPILDFMTQEIKLFPNINKHTMAVKKWYQPHLAGPTTLPGHSFTPLKKGITEAHRTRVRQLSHVLYDKIAELMNSSEFSEEIVSKQVLVTSVKMQVDFSSIHVYWDCHRSDAADVETLLLNHANKLRSLLISYHVLGRIPPIIFKKDKSHGDLALIDQLLEIADYGPDYVPSSPHFQVKGYGEISSSTPEAKNGDFAAELSLSLTQMAIDLSGSVQNKQESDSESDRSNLSAGKPNELQEDSLTPGLIFRSDIYGLPRDKLLKKIVAQRDRVKFQPGDLETKPTADEEFDSRKLLHQKDKVLLREWKGSTKIKQKLLEREVGDFYKVKID